MIRIAVEQAAFCIGELTVDWLSLEYGESMMTARQFYRYMGGNATNVAVGLARLGLKSAVISRVGDDIHGEYLLASLQAEGVDASWVVKDSLQPTAQCYMTRRKDGLPDYYSWPSPNASKMLDPDDVKDECFENSWIWHLAAVSFIAKPRRFAMEHSVKKADEYGKIISFDACFPLVDSRGGREAAWQAMHSADILKFNLAELAYWSSSPFDADLKTMVSQISRKLHPAILIVTLAEKGAWLFCREQAAFCPPYPVKSVGDVGPGDAFSAGLIYGLSTLGDGSVSKSDLRELKLDDWVRLSRYASCAGALVTRSYSATESFPKLDELKLALGETTLRS